MRYLLWPLALMISTLGTAAVSPSSVPGPSLISVSKCVPEQGVYRAGYTPAYYPMRPYSWRNVYGYTYYQPAYASSAPSLSIDYTNISSKTMREIEFGLIARGELIAEVKDIGTFTTGAEIKHQFGLSPNVFPIGTGLSQCVPLKISFADGTTWRSPHLPKRHS